jgi:DNA-binding MarR family transcriptional regulator
MPNRKRASSARARESPSASDDGDERTGIGTRYEGPSASPGFLLWRVAMVWQRKLRAALVDVGLTHAQFVLLASAGWLEAQAAEQNGEPVTQTLIAAHASTDAVMTSEVLRTLERKRLIQRLPHPSDARAKHIVLTSAGRRLVRKAIALVEAADEEFFGARGPELEALARLLC